MSQESFSHSIRAKTPPSPPGQFILGHALDYAKNPLGFLEACARDYGDTFSVQLFTMQTLVLNHPKDIETVLRTRNQDFIKDQFTRLPLLGNGLLSSHGDFWKKQRRLIAPALSLGQIQQYADTIVQYSEQMLQKFSVEQTKDIHKQMMALTLQIVGKSLFGTEVQSLVEKVSDAVDTVMKYYAHPLTWVPVISALPTKKKRQSQKAVKEFDTILYQLIKERRQNSEGNDLLLSLIRIQDEQGSTMTDSQLRDEALILFLAGHETTALALSYTFYLLAKHPEAEEKLYQEISRVLGDRPACYDDLEKLSFTQAVLKESMRLYPPAWGIGREACVDMEIGGYFIAKGTQVYMHQWLVHRDLRFYRNPNTFYPERWLEGLEERLPRCAYFPFGDGARICVGNHFAMMEATLILASFLRRFRFSLIDQSPLEFLPSITLRPKGEILMKITSR